MRNVAESDAFRAFEGQQSVLNVQNNQLNSDANYQDKINEAVESILAEQVSQSEEGVLGSGKIELAYEPELPWTGLKETELQREQIKKYKALDEQLDSIEKTVGTWNPLNQFLTAY